MVHDAGEGSTWYELDMQPVLYWTFFTDHMLRSIHARVLEHIARGALEARAQAPSSGR